MNGTVVSLGILFIVIGFCVGISGVYTVKEIYPPYSNPTIIETVIYPNTTVGIVIVLIGIMGLVIGCVMPKGETS